MNNLLNKNSRLILWIAAAFIIFNSCDEPDDLGIELLPSTDLIEVGTFIDTTSIRGYIYKVDTLRTDEPGNPMLGSLNDPLFGTTTINFASTYRILAFPDFGTNPIADSINLYLYYRVIYGDTVTPQNFRVYELKDPLEYDQSYYQEVELNAMAYDELLGEKTLIPRVRLDSTTADTFYQRISIPLDISLAEKLLAADSATMASTERFLDYFKGLYVETEKQTAEGGAILYLELLESTTFDGSGLALFYSNEENRDTSYLYPYLITPLSARINSYQHDYTGTPFYDELNTDVNTDSLIYLQATGGLNSKIIIDELAEWRDSITLRSEGDTLPYAINHAQITLQIDTLASDLDKFPPPNQLLLTYINKNGDLIPTEDYLVSPNLYGGVLNRENYTYTFVITQHMQNILKGNIDNYELYLSIADSNSTASRVVLKGHGSKAGIRFRITYSKFL